MRHCDHALGPRTVRRLPGMQSRLSGRVVPDHGQGPRQAGYLRARPHLEVPLAVLNAMTKVHFPSLDLHRAAKPIALLVVVLVGCGSEDLREASEAEHENVNGCAGAGGTSGSGGSTGASGASMDSSMPDVGSPREAGMDERAPRDARMDEPFVPGPPYIAPAHQGNLVHVKNGCSLPILIHRGGGGDAPPPDGL